MSINSKIIQQDGHSLSLRMTPHAKFIVIHNDARFPSKATFNLYDSLGDHLQEIPRRQEAYHMDRITNVFDISPNGRYLATAYRGGSSVYRTRCYIWDVAQKIYLNHFIQPDMRYKSWLSGNAGQGYHFLDVRFLPDSDRLILVSDMGEIFLWSISQQKQLLAITAAAHHANAVAFSHQFKLFVMTEHQSDWQRGQIGQHTISDNKFFYPQHNHWHAYELLNFGYSLRLWNFYSGSLVREFDADYLVSDLVFSNDNKYIAGSMEGTAFIWDVNTGEILDALPENTKPIGFTKNSRSLIVIYESDTIALWDMEAKSWQQRFKLEGLITSAQLSQNDKIVALSKAADGWHLHQIQL